MASLTNKKSKITDDTVIIKKIIDIGLHFSKIASSYKFENDATSYLNWVIRFEAEMNNYNLGDVLKTNPEATSSSGIVNIVKHRIQQQRQKSVYHMILKCVPKEATLVVTRSLPSVQQTGYGAFIALREFYIGEERAYVAKLEDRFNSIQWKNGESWATFETEFDSLVNDLSAIGTAKDEHQRKIRIMNAIQESGRKDAEGNSVYTRLHVTNQINQKESYRAWLVSIRTEAQKIQDEIEWNKNKKVRRGNDSSSNSDHVGEVSLLVGMNDSSSSSTQRPTQNFMQHKPSNNPSKGKLNLPCRNYQRSGHCKFGANCRFSHTSSSTGTNNPQKEFKSNNDTKRFKVNKQCFKFAEGKCEFGNRCRYLHTTSSGNNSASNNLSADIDQNAFMVDVANVESMNIIMKDDATSSHRITHTHRIIIDSGCSENITCRLDWLRNLRPLIQPITIRGAFGKTRTSTKCGDIYFTVKGSKFTVKDVIYCDSLQDTLLSYVKLANHGHHINTSQKKLILKSGNYISLSMAGNIITFANQPTSINITTSAETLVLTRSQLQQSESSPPA